MPVDRGSISYRLWKAINAIGSSYVCRSSGRILARGMHVNDLKEAGRDANVISDEIVDPGWKARQRMRPDHPVWLICGAVKPHENSRGWKGPHCAGVLRLVANRLDLPPELIAERFGCGGSSSCSFARSSSSSARGNRCCAAELRTQRGAAHALERAMGAIAATMAKRSGHAESRGQEGRDERPARGRGQFRAVADSLCRLTTCTYVGSTEPGQT